MKALIGASGRKIKVRNGGGKDEEAERGEVDAVVLLRTVVDWKAKDEIAEMDYGGQCSVVTVDEYERCQVGELAKSNESIFAKGDYDLGECKLEPVKIALIDQGPVFKYPIKHHCQKKGSF